MHRLLVFAATGFVALALSGSALAWSWPSEGDVLRPFALGGDAYAAGQHRGIDVAGSEGSAVRAPASGTVTFAGSLPTYGRGVTVATADGYAVTLVHLGSIGVAKGDVVAEGAPIGTMGWSGDAEHAVPSVHLGIRVAAQAEGYVDPLGLLPPRSVPAPAPPPVRSPAPVVASSAVAPAAAPAAPPTTTASSPQPAAPAAAAQPTPTVPAPPSVTAPQVSVAAPATPASAASAAAEATAADAAPAVGAASPGLTVTGGRSADAVGNVSFRVAARRDVTRVATRTTAPRVTERGRAVDTATSTRVTSRPAAAAVPAARTQSATAPEGPVARVVPRSPVHSTALAVHEHPSVRVAAAPAHGPIASLAVLAAVPPGSALQPSEPSPPAALPAPSIEDGVRPGVLVAAALLLLLAVAAAAKAARRIGGDGAVLRHHADLLRELHSAHRARLHDRGGRRVRTPPTAARP